MPAGRWGKGDSATLVAAQASGSRSPCTVTAPRCHPRAPRSHRPALPPPRAARAHARAQVLEKCTINARQAGTELAAAGYCLYSCSTVLVLTMGHGVFGFTLDRGVGEFVLTDR